MFEVHRDSRLVARSVLKCPEVPSERDIVRSTTILESEQVPPLVALWALCGRRQLDKSLLNGQSSSDDVMDSISNAQPDGSRSIFEPDKHSGRASLTISPVYLTINRY